MSDTITHFPKLAEAASRRDKPQDDTELVLNGAKVIFDKEAVLMPVNLQEKKQTGHGTHERH